MFGSAHSCHLPLLSKCWSHRSMCVCQCWAAFPGGTEDTIADWKSIWITFNKHSPIAELQNIVTLFTKHRWSKSLIPLRHVNYKHFCKCFTYFYCGYVQHSFEWVWCFCLVIYSIPSVLNWISICNDNKGTARRDKVCEVDMISRFLFVILWKFLSFHVNGEVSVSI